MNTLCKKKPTWSEEEIDFLSESWGQQSIKRIAGKLKRSEKAVMLMASRLKLGAFLDAGDYITFNQLLKELGIGESYKITSWVKQKDFPIRRKKVVNSFFLIVKIDEFWKWAEEHIYLIDFSKLEENVLGEEPEWVKVKRKLDIRRKELINTKSWTKSEDNMLKNLLQKQCYTYYDMQIKLRRTAGAIGTRCVKLGLKDRPVKTENKKWSVTEIKRIKKMIFEGYGYELISFEYKVSDKKVRGLIGRLFGTENLDKAREKIKEECYES